MTRLFHKRPAAAGLTVLLLAWVLSGPALAQLDPEVVELLVERSKADPRTTVDPLPEGALGVPGPLFRDISTALDFRWHDVMPQTLVVAPTISPLDPRFDPTTFDPATAYLLGGSPTAVPGQSAAPDGASYGLSPLLNPPADGNPFAKGEAGRLLNSIFGGGVCLADFDGDGRLDIYFTNGRGEPESESGDPFDNTFSTPFTGRGLAQNALYLNRGNDPAGDPTFVEAAAASGSRGNGYFGLGCVAADYDNDGDADLYVLNAGPNQLLRNDDVGENGVPRFTDVTAEASASGLLEADAAGPDRDLRAIARGPNGRAQGIAVTPSGNFVDVDRDGCLDLAVVTHSVGPYILALDLVRTIDPTTLARSFDGDGVYPADQAASTTSPTTYWTSGESFLFHQERGEAGCTGSFRNIAPAVDFLQVAPNVSVVTGDDVVDRPMAAFVASWTDFDLDGDPDAWVANDFGPVQYLRNDLEVSGTFTDATAELSEPGDPSSGSNLTGEWMSVAFGDIDRDGDFDIFSSNVGPTFFEERIRLGLMEPNDWSPQALFLNQLADKGTVTNISMLTGVRPQLGVAAASPEGVAAARELEAVDDEAVMLITGAGPDGGPVGNGGPAVSDDGGGVRPAGALSIADAELRLRCSRKDAATGCSELTPWIADQTSIASGGGFGWGAQFLDYDNDGHLDLFQVGNSITIGFGLGLGGPGAFNGTLGFFGFPDPNIAGPNLEPFVVNPYFEDGNLGHGFLYRNTGGTNSAGLPIFVRVPVRRLGFFNLADARGTAVGDLNGDGFLDIVINNIQAASVPPESVAVEDILLPGRDGGKPSDFDYQALRGLWQDDVDGALARVLINNARGDGNWLAVRARGVDSNRDGIGARVTVRPLLGEATLVREIRSGEGYQASNAPVAHFGVGSSFLATVTVRFPSGAVRTAVTTANRTLTIREDGPAFQPLVP